MSNLTPIKNLITYVENRLDISDDAKKGIMEYLIQYMEGVKRDALINLVESMRDKLTTLLEAKTNPQE